MKPTYLSHKMVRVFFLIFSLLFFIGCDEDDESQQNPNTIVEILNSNPDFEIISNAILVTELRGTLSDESASFTLFVPTANAFDKFFEFLGDDFSSIEDFDTAEEIELLQKILLFHVTSPSLEYNDIEQGNLSTLNQESELNIIVNGNNILIEDASEHEALLFEDSIEATNGTIFKIDKVLLPQCAIDYLNVPELDIMGTIVTSNELTTLEHAINITNFVITFSPPASNPNTVLAPSDAAFQRFFDFLGPDYTNIFDFGTDEEIDLLRNFLKYHLIPLKIEEYEFSTGSLETRLIGQHITVNVRDNGGNKDVEFIDNLNQRASISNPDIQCFNGVIHIIDNVLSPSAVGQ